MFDLIFVCVIFSIEIIVCLYIYIKDKLENNPYHGYVQVHAKSKGLAEELLPNNRFQNK